MTLTREKEEKKLPLLGTRPCVVYLNFWIMKTAPAPKESFIY